MHDILVRLVVPVFSGHAGHVSAVIVHSATSHLPDDPPDQRILFVYLRFLTNITKKFHKTLSRTNGCEHLARTHFRPVTARNGTTWHVLVLHTPLLPPQNIRNMLNLAVLVVLVFPMSLSHLIPSHLIRHPLRCLEMPKDSWLEGGKSLSAHLGRTKYIPVRVGSCWSICHEEDPSI